MGTTIAADKPHGVEPVQVKLPSGPDGAEKVTISRIAVHATDGRRRWCQRGIPRRWPCCHDHHYVHRPRLAIEEPHVTAKFPAPARSKVRTV